MFKFSVGFALAVSLYTVFILYHALHQSLNFLPH